MFCGDVFKDKRKLETSLILWKLGKNLLRIYALVQLSPQPPPSTLTTFIPLTLWTCRLQSPTLINHWGWPSTLLGSAQPAQTSSLIACASGGWSVSYAPALALGVGPAWHGCSHFTSQPCQPCVLLLGLHVFVCVYSLAIYCWPASHKWTSSLVYVHFLSLLWNPKYIKHHSYLYCKFLFLLLSLSILTSFFLYLLFSSISVSAVSSLSMFPFSFLYVQKSNWVLYHLFCTP